MDRVRRVGLPNGRMDRVRRVGLPNGRAPKAHAQNDYALKRFRARWMAAIMVSISSEVL